MFYQSLIEKRSKNTFPIGFTQKFQKTTYDETKRAD